MRTLRWVAAGTLAALALGVAAQQVAISTSSVFSTPIVAPAGAAAAVGVQVGTNAGTGAFAASANQVALCANALCSVTVTNGGTVIDAAGGVLNFGSTSITIASNTAPTISSGFGTSPAVVAGAGTFTFRVTVGTGGIGATGVLTMPTATNGWICLVNDETTTSASVFVTKQTASTTTSVTVGNFTTAGVSGPWTAADALLFQCMGR